jgi:hypothetical protein
MAGEKPVAGSKRRGTSAERRRNLQETAGQDEPEKTTVTVPESPAAAFFRAHALSLVIFLIAFFFIVTITNPALYINDEWITANQLHQLDLGHQVIFSEGKYGVLENGSAIRYFTLRQNILMYSLALPVAALPFVKIFSIFGDNFRMLVILAWSLSLMAIALLVDMYYPAYSRISGIRLFYPALFLSLFLFMANILLYKQFPFSAPDAPFEVAAIVMANHVFFALTVVIIFETFQAIQQNTWLSLIGTISCSACSSFLFWAGTGKDHMLAAAVFACVIFFFVLYLINEQQRDAFISFFFCGLLVWVRPEVGFFVTLCSGALYSIPLFLRFFRKESPSGGLLQSFAPMTGAVLGGIPFFINNLLTTHNLLIPVFDLPRPLVESGTSPGAPLRIEQVTNNMDLVNQTGGMSAGETLIRVYEMISHVMFRSFSFDNLVQGFSGVMFFPGNGNIGFLIMCPLVLLALVAFAFWYGKIMDVTEKRRNLYLFFLVMGLAAIFSYLPKLGAMNISSGILPDMRYLSPAYIPFGILSILVLSRTPVLKKPRRMVSDLLIAGLIITPALFFFMIIVHPFGAINAGYMLFFKVMVVLGLLLAIALMVLTRFVIPENPLLLRCLPWAAILLVITVFTFQLVLVFIFGVIVKMNGYPLWIPLIRESFSTFFTVTVIPPG